MRTWFDNHPEWRDLLPIHIRLSDNYRLFFVKNNTQMKNYLVYEDGTPKVFQTILETAVHYGVSTATISEHRRNGKRLPLDDGRSVVIIGRPYSNDAKYKKEAV